MRIAAILNDYDRRITEKKKKPPVMARLLHTGHGILYYGMYER